MVVLIALFAPWIAPQNPFDPAALDLADARIPPAWLDGGQWRFPLGTDGQGRDLLSVLMYGLRISLLVSVCATLFALVVGVTLGLVSGYVGGRVDNLIMRLADMQLSFPTILVALLIDGLSRSLLPRTMHEQLALVVVIFAIGISTWVQYARTVRGATLVEKNKDYVHAARLIGMGPLRILFQQVLPNVLGSRAGDRDALARPRDPDRGNAELPGPRRAADLAVARHAHPHRQRGALLRRVVGHGNARRLPGRAGAWRSTCSATGCAMSSIPSSSNRAVNDPLLRVRGLRVEIPTRHGVLLALDDVSFAIAPGEVLGFVGESGAGKSLTGMAILGLLEPPGHVAAGEVWLGERRIDTLPPREMRRVRGKDIGAVFQDPLMSLNPLLTIGEQLDETIRTHLPVGARAVIIPGGHAPDKMRMRHAMVDLARDAMEAGKPVAAICHGPQVLISANVLRGRTLTCWPSIAIDVKNAGGLYVDKPVVEDGNLITSRKPDDVPVFSEAIIKALARPVTLARSPQ